MTAVVAVRLHEIFPVLRVIKPAVLVVGIGVIALLARTPWSVVQRSLQSRPFYWSAAYVAWGLFTIPTSLWVGQSIGIYRGLLPAFALWLPFLLCAPTGVHYRKMSEWFAGLITALALSAHLFGDTGRSGRLSVGGTYDENDLATVLSAGLPFAYAAAVRNRGAKRLAWIGAIGLLLVTVALTGSRGGILAVGGAALVFLMGFRGRRFAGMVAAVMIASLALWNFGPPMLQERARSLLNLEEDYNMDAESGRMEIWKRGIQYVKLRPVFGAGIGNFAMAEGAHWESLGRTGKWSAPHNSFIQAFAETGLPGGLFFVAYLAALAKIGFRYWRPDRRRRKPHRPELLAALIGFIIGAFFLSLAYFYALFALGGLIVLGGRSGRLEAARALRRMPRAQARPAPVQRASPLR